MAKAWMGRGSASNLLASHAVVWTVVALVASGALDRMLIQPGSQPMRRAWLPQRPEKAAMVTLASLCVARVDPKLRMAQDKEILSVLDERACAALVAPGARHVASWMVPAGSKMVVRFESGGAATLNMGVGNYAYHALEYDAGEARPWTMRMVGGERPGSEAVCREDAQAALWRQEEAKGAPVAEAQKKCAPLFSFVDPLDDHYGEWTTLYMLSREIAALF